MWYLKSAFETYEKLQDAVQNRLSEVQSAILSPVDMMKRFLTGTTSSSPTSTDQASEVQGLRRRVAELEVRLANSSRGKRNAAKKR